MVEVKQIVVEEHGLGFEYLICSLFSFSILSLLFYYFLFVNFITISFICFGYLSIFTINIFLVFPSELLSPCICQPYFEMFLLSQGSIGNSFSTSQGKEGRSNICVHSTLLRTHLWDHTGYVFVVLIVFFTFITQTFNAKVIKVFCTHCQNGQTKI